jgi:alpha-glucosidase
VPIPWEADKPAFGFGPSADTWLPQPAEYREYSRDLQTGVEGSTLELYRTLLRLRRDFGLGAGTFEWLPGYPVEVLALVNNGIRVYFNMSDAPVALPEGEVLVASADVSGGLLPASAAAWIR